MNNIVTDIFLFASTTIAFLIHMKRTKKPRQMGDVSKPKGYEIRASFIKNAMNNKLTYRQKMRNYMISKLFVEVTGVKMNVANRGDIADFMQFFKQYVFAMKQRYVVFERDENEWTSDAVLWDGVENEQEIRNNFADYAVEIKNFL